MLRSIHFLCDAEVPATGAAVTETPAAAAQEAKPPKVAEAKPSPTEAEIRASVLKELGVANADEVRAAVALAKEAAEAKKSDSEKLASAQAELATSKAASATLGDVLRAQVATVTATLTAEQKAAVVAIAGDDPVKQLSAIQALRPTWTQPPADTAPPKTGVPAPAGSAGKADAKAQYAALLATNPIVAAHYLLRNPSALG